MQELEARAEALAQVRSAYMDEISARVRQAEAILQKGAPFNELTDGSGLRWTGERLLYLDRPLIERPFADRARLVGELDDFVDAVLEEAEAALKLVMK